MEATSSSAVLQTLYGVFSLSLILAGSPNAVLKSCGVKNEAKKENVFGQKLYCMVINVCLYKYKMYLTRTENASTP